VGALTSRAAFPSRGLRCRNRREQQSNALLFVQQRRLRLLSIRFRYPARCRCWAAGGLSVERDYDLAVGAALLDVRQGFEGLVERERRVDDRAEVARVVEGGELVQLGAVGLHEQE
jgi:hypothetical protein